MRFFVFFLLITLTSQLTADELRMKVPEGWGCVTDAEQLPKKIRLIAIAPTKGRFTPSINLATEETNLELVEYLENAKLYHESEGEGGVTTLGNIATQSGSATLLQIDRKSEWGVVRIIQAALIQEETAYVITATCLRDEFASYCGRFFEAIQSFEISKKD